MIFGCITKCFFPSMAFINSNLSNVNLLECFSMNNQECKIRTEIILTLINLCFILIVLK